MNKFQEELYQKITIKRDKIMRPFSIILSRLKITPNLITATGVLFMLGFVYFLPAKPIWAVNCIIFSILCDLLDGSLARYQKINSDQGKFIDVSADALNYFIFLCGLAITEKIIPLTLLVLAFFMLLSKIFRIFLNSNKYNSDWIFRSVAGFIPNLIAGLSYAYIIFSFYFEFNNLQNQIFFIFAIVLIGDSITNFLKILKQNEI